MEGEHLEEYSRQIPRAASHSCFPVRPLEGQLFSYSVSAVALITL